MSTSDTSTAPQNQSRPQNQKPSQKPLLIVNPNSTTEMTTALHPTVTHALSNSTLPPPTYLTGPLGSSPPSINSPHDALLSTTATLPLILPLLNSHSGVLIACYSPHPLVQAVGSVAKIPVLGILEASLGACLLVLGRSGNGGGEGDGGKEEGKGKERKKKMFGIVTTGSIWESVLSNFVHSFLGSSPSPPNPSTIFAGTTSTGLSATELHTTPPEIVHQKLKEATTKLVGMARERGGELGAVCLGCAGMVGMEGAVREGLVEGMGGKGVGGEEGDGGMGVVIVDGVRAGVGGLGLLGGL